MEIKSADTRGWRTGHLRYELPYDEIVRVLGFKPNIDDEYPKVENSWGFTVDGVPCAIWDYHGMRWSTFGPHEILEKLFPGMHTDETDGVPIPEHVGALFAL